MEQNNLLGLLLILAGVLCLLSACRDIINPYRRSIIIEDENGRTINKIKIPKNISRPTGLF
jgi:hypothetical protein